MVSEEPGESGHKPKAPLAWFLAASLAGFPVYRGFVRAPLLPPPSGLSLPPPRLPRPAPPHRCLYVQAGAAPLKWVGGSRVCNPGRLPRRVGRLSRRGERWRAPAFSLRQHLSHFGAGAGAWAVPAGRLRCPRPEPCTEVAQGGQVGGPDRGGAAGGGGPSTQAGPPLPPPSPAHTEAKRGESHTESTSERKRSFSDPGPRCSPPPSPSWSPGPAGEGGSVLSPRPVRGLRLPGEVPASPGLAGGAPRTAGPPPLPPPPSPPPPRVLPEPGGLIPAPPTTSPSSSSSRFARFPGGVEKSKVATAAGGLCPGKGGAMREGDGEALQRGQGEDKETWFARPSPRAGSGLA